MTRYIDHSDDWSAGAILAQGRWENNARRTLKGKRGRKALAELREALMALPEHKLIEGAICTVGAAQRRAAILAEAERDKAYIDQRYAGRYGPAELDMSRARQFDSHVERDGEGVCAIGAYVWYRKVKAGDDAAEAFASLPDLADEGCDGLQETAALAEAEAGLTYTLAWELAYRNDETLGSKTPEERWQAFVDWIDRELAEAGETA